MKQDKMNLQEADEVRDLQGHEPRVGGRLAVEGRAAAAPVDGDHVEVADGKKRFGHLLQF